MGRTGGKEHELVIVSLGRPLSDAANLTKRDKTPECDAAHTTLDPVASK